jgi:hypothetical protein
MTSFIFLWFLRNWWWWSWLMGFERESLPGYLDFLLQNFSCLLLNFVAILPKFDSLLILTKMTKTLAPYSKLYWFLGEGISETANSRSVPVSNLYRSKSTNKKKYQKFKPWFIVILVSLFYFPQMQLKKITLLLICN